MPLMKSLRDIRLSNTSGHCVLVTADEPINIPPGLYADAITSGMVECDTAEPVKEPELIVETQTAEEIAAQRAAELDAAILIVLTRNSEEDFKKDGTPKATKVVAELAPEFDPTPSATEISDAYQKLQENFDLAED